MKLSKCFGTMLVLGTLTLNGAMAQTAQTAQTANFAAEEGSGHSGGGGDYKSDTISEVCGTPSIDEMDGDLLSATTINSSSGGGISTQSVPAPHSRIMINGVPISTHGDDSLTYLQVARTAIRLHKDLCFRKFYKDLGYKGAFSENPGLQWRAGNELYVKP